jgi:CopG family nickel-responsive transcriptional regulator
MNNSFADQQFRESGVEVLQTMAELTRTGVSIEEDLLQQFDELIARRGYSNRSEAIRDLIRESLVTDAVNENKTVVATLSLVYDHHLPNLGQKLTEMQHHAHGAVLAATHVHLDDVNCLEVIIMKGNSKEIRQLADHMLSLRGVKHGKLVMTTTADEQRHAHGKAHAHNHNH